jgi:hypothetical protein
MTVRIVRRSLAAVAVSLGAGWALFGSASYAATGTQSDTSSQADTYESIRAEIAGALGLAESSPSVDKAYQELVVQQREASEDARVAEHRAVIEAALANGRRVEDVIKMDGTTPDRTKFIEYVAGTFGGIDDARIRRGYEVVVHGFFSDTVVRTTDYYDGFEWVANVTSEITDGKETVISVIVSKPGVIDLKPGDTRDVPAALRTAAGLAPSTWDPKADGTLGMARPGAAGTGTASTPSGNASGSSSTTTSSDASSGRPSAAESHDRPVHESYHGETSSSGSSSDSSSPAGSDAAVPAADSATAPAAPGSTTNSSTTQHWDGATSDTDGDKERSAGEWSEETHTTVEGNYTVEVEKPTDDDTEYVADDGYSSTGPIPSAQVGVGSGSETVGDHSMKTYSGVFGTFFGTLEHARTGNPHTVSGDYGDPNDPNASSPNQDDVHPPSNDPWIHVDPDAAAGQAVIAMEQHNVQVSIHGGDFVNPNDPLFGENTVIGGGDPQGTSPYEHGTDATAHDDGLKDDDPLS